MRDKVPSLPPLQLMRNPIIRRPIPLEERIHFKREFFGKDGKRFEIQACPNLEVARAIMAAWGPVARIMTATGAWVSAKKFPWQRPGGDRKSAEIVRRKPALQEAGRESAGAAPVVPAPVAPSSYTATQTETKKEASEEGGDAAAVQEAGRAAPVAPVAPAPEQPEEVVSQPEVSGERGPVASRQCPARCPECEDEDVVSYCCAPIIAGVPHDHQCPLHRGWRPGAGAHRR